jgi:acyl phosphate:glycerol-3-phosphate acyltransferase
MPEIAQSILFLIAAYLIGSIPMSYLVVKLRYKVDIRNFGTGQVGGGNIFRSFSKPVGAIVGLYDAGKGIFLVWIAHWLGLGLAVQIAGGLAVIVGHNWPVFLRFNAGRGVATTIGVGLYLLPLGIPAFLFCALFTLFWGASPLPILLAVVTLPLSSLALGKPLVLTLGMTALLLVLIVRRLTAPKSEGAINVNQREVFVNRLLFDRDIRDGNVWIRRKPFLARTADKSKKQGKG